MRVGRKKRMEEAPARRQALSAQPAKRPSSTDISERYAFRRNRTLTGSSSPVIASSNELNAELRSPRAHAHHLTKLRRTLLLYLGGVTVTAFCLYLFVAQIIATMTFQVANAGVIPKADQAAMSQSVESYFAARPIERFRFLLKTDELVSHIQANRPEVKGLKVEPGASFGEASIRIEARQPIAHWSMSGSNQYVDGEGVVFARNYFADPSLQIIDNSGLGSGSSRMVASNRFLGFIGRVIAGSATSGLSIDTVTIPALTTRQVAVTLAGQKTEYKLSVDRSAGEQVEDITRVARHMSANGITPAYVDVRVEERAYYR